MSVSAAAAASGLLTIIQIIEAAADAKPIIDALKAAGAKGASFEELLDIARNSAVTSEADTAARINK